MQPGHYIRKSRQKAGLSLRELADKVGVSHVFIGALERNVKRVPDEMVEKLAKHLPDLKAARLRALVKENEPFRLEMKLGAGVERDLVLAFARKAEHGFTESELNELRRLLGMAPRKREGDPARAPAGAWVSRLPSPGRG